MPRQRAAPPSPPLARLTRIDPSLAARPMPRSGRPRRSPTARRGPRRPPPNARRSHTPPTPPGRPLGRSRWRRPRTRLAASPRAGRRNHSFRNAPAPAGPSGCRGRSHRHTSVRRPLVGRTAIAPGSGPDRSRQRSPRPAGHRMPGSRAPAADRPARWAAGHRGSGHRVAGARSTAPIPVPAVSRDRAAARPRQRSAPPAARGPR